MTQAKRQPAKDDVLWRALEHVFRYYRLRVDRKLLYAQSSIDAAHPLSPDDAVALCGHAGFSGIRAGVTQGRLDDLRIPAILLPENGAPMVYTPGEGGAPGAFFDPATGKECPAPAGLDRRETAAVLVEKRTGADEGPLQPRQLQINDWFWKSMGAHSGAYLDVIATTFFINVFAVALPIYTMNVYDRVVPNYAQDTLLALTIGILIAFAFNFAFKVIRGAVLENIAARMAATLDADLMGHILRLPASGTALSVGEKSNLFREVQSLRDFFAVRLMPAVMDLPFFILFLVVIHQISPGLMPVVLCGVALMFIVNLAAQAPVNRKSHAAFKQGQLKNAALVELLSGAETLRLFAAVGEKLRSWKRMAESSAVTARHSQHMTTVANDLSITIMYLVNVFVVFFGVQEIQDGKLSMGGLIACSILVSRAIAPVMALASVVGQFQRSLDSLRMIGRLFSQPAEPALGADYQPKAPFKGLMELRDVVFTYPGQPRPTLEHVSITIKPGEKVGIIGRTGAGKSTVLHLLEGAVAPKEGHLFLDGVSATAVHPDEWRHALGVVPQDIFLFSGTLRDNILLGMHPEEVDEEWLGKVLHMSGLEALMHQGGNGADYDVGEGGRRLSGGQKQAIALARALVRKPSILLLDEPTSGMDHTLEQHVRNQMHEYSKGRTLVMVTHRTTLLPLVDRLILIDNGRVAADGPRDKILERLSGGGAGVGGGGAHG